jgi:6-phosphogluconolactonase
MVHAALTHQPFVPVSHVHRIRGELPAHEAAKAYEATLRSLFGDVGFPPFDLVLLGLGSDGHTASLFPHSPALSEHTKWVVAQRVDKLDRERITLTYPALNAARAIVFLVAGADKAEALRAVLEGDRPIDEIPARGIAPVAGSVTFVADAAAAARLTTY